MNPISLTLKGVYSYKEKQTIDFRELTSDHLFGIFGAVGSGKSSILEAITFALYGKIERLNSKGLKYNMMNLSSNEMFIDFTFQANNGEFYNTISHNKRNSKKHGDVNSVNRSCYRLDSANPELKIPITAEDIESVIGLSYENFKRTIIIPQGKFQEFLKLGTKDRSNMLEEIFELKKFNLFYKVQSLISKSLTRKSEIEGSLTQIGTINPDAQQQLTVEIETTVKSILDKSSEKGKREVQKNILDQLKKSLEEIESIKEQLKILENRRIEVELKRNLLEQYRTFITAFKPIIEQKISLEHQLDELNKTIQFKDESLKNTINAIEAIQNQLIELTPAFESRAILLEKATDITHLVEIKRQQNLAIGVDKKFEEIAKNRVVKIANQEAKSVAIKQLEEQLELLKKQSIDINTLNEAKSWHVLKDKIITEGKEKSERVKLLHDEIVKIDGDIKTLLIEVNIEPSEDFDQILNAISSQIEVQKRLLETLEPEISELKLAQQLSSFSNTLHEGKPCPLCGALEHPNIQVHADVSTLLLEAQKRQKSLEVSIEKGNKIHTQLKGKQEQKIGIIQKNELAQLELEKQREEFKEHENRFVFDEKFKVKSWIEAEIETYKRNSASISTKENELKNLRETLESTTKEIAFIEEELHLITLQKTEFSTIIKQRTEALKHLFPTNFAYKTEIELIQIGEDFTQKHHSIEKLFESLTQKRIELKSEQSEGEGMLKELNNQLTKLNTLKLEISNKLIETQNKYPQISSEVILLFTTSPLNIEQEESAIKQFDEQNIALKASLKTLEDKNTNSHYDAEQHNQLIEQISLYGEQIQLETEKKGQLEKQLEFLTKQLSEHQQLITELDKLSNRIGDLSKISGMFKGNGFVNYVSTYYLENLCKEANKRFIKLTNGHLELTLSSDNSFDVIDHLNNGYIRSSDSLSGGQTFQASLCLALALSDAINRKSNIQQNFFFMDEGFGSLDNQSLHTVFQTLQALRLENRIVGLISHVEEMKQEIPKCLIISNTDERGSRIGFSWK